MSFEIRPVTPDEVAAYVQVGMSGFGAAVVPERLELGWTTHDLERALAVLDGGDIVASGRVYSLEVTVPAAPGGGELVPAAGVSWVSVLPTHRRRGILSALMDRLLDDAVARGESLAILHASEGVIHRRFGYGVATSGLGFTLDRRHSGFLQPVPAGGRVRLIDDATARKNFPPIFDRARRRQPGAVERVDAWWSDQLFWSDPKEPGARFFVSYESPARELDGYAAYRIEEKWADGVARNRLSVNDLVTVTPEARAALWRYLCDVDLVETISAWAVPVDDPLRWLLAESRRLHVNRLTDELWVRILDVPAALTARRYASAGRLVLEVVDERRPDGAAAGRFSLEGGPDGASVSRTDADPDLVLAVAELGAAYLGGVDLSTLGRAGLVEEHNPGALARADAMFRATPTPSALTWF